MDKSQIAVDIFNKHATSYESKFMDVSLYHHSFDVFCKHIVKQQADVLELACGPGNITKYLLHVRPDLNILATDLAPNMVELAKANNPTAKVQVMDSRAINQFHKKYDALMVGFCLPYLSKEEALQLIQDAANILHPNAVIYLSTMEDDYSKSAFKKGSAGDEIFMHYHQADYLSAALTKNGFVINELIRQAYPEKDGSQTTDLILIATYLK
jgi:2-polyprenyl-3-methyl-5-hydroxy-6-metoxy-1,4-benzoquinol methylase